MKIFYIHHAKRKKNTPPSQMDGITNIGKKDTKLVAKIFSDAKKKGENIVAIYTSPFLRCKKTAKIINKLIDIPIFEEERLNEFGSIKEEKWIDCQIRTRDFLKDIIAKYNDEDVIICVTSGVNLTAFIGQFYKIKSSNKLPYPIVPSCSPIGFEINKSDLID